MRDMDIDKKRIGLPARLFRLIIGLFLYSVGIVFTLKAQVGFAPWDVLHVGLAKTTGSTIGLMSILVGVLLVAVSLALGEKIGLGTLLNMVLIGVFLDMILYLDIVPAAEHFVTGVGMLFFGLMIISVASYFYIGAGLGAGPRDSLMVALARKTKLPIGFCRGLIEILAVAIGWKLGGMVGIGTVIAAVMIGFCIQFTFWTLKFDAKKIRHRSLLNLKDDIYGTM